MRGMGVERGREPDLTQGPGATAPGTPSAPESGDAGGPRGAGAPTVHRARWWYRGPFVRREVRISVGLVLAFLFVFYVALPLLASHRSEVSALSHIHVQYLVLGVVLEIGALAAYTQLTHAVLPADGPKRFRLFRINMSTLALSHVSPGGTAPGAALGYRLLTQSGVSGADAGFALGTQGIGSAVVLNALFWLSLVAFLLVNGFHAPTSQHAGTSVSGSALVVVAALVGVILLGAGGALFYLLTRGQERAKVVVHRLAVRLRLHNPDRVAALVERMAERFALLMEDRPLLYRALGWATANWLLDAASLWVFVAAFSHFISPVDLMVAYGLANILAAIPITPGGLGVVEFVLVSMITGFGPTAGQALSGVLAYRAVNFWLPIPFGGMAYASLELEQGTLYRRLSLFFLHRYQRRRDAATGGGRTGDTGPATDATPTAAEPAGPAGADPEVDRRPAGDVPLPGLGIGTGADDVPAAPTGAATPGPTVSRASGTGAATTGPAGELPEAGSTTSKRRWAWARARPTPYA